MDRMRAPEHARHPLGDHPAFQTNRVLLPTGAAASLFCAIVVMVALQDGARLGGFGAFVISIVFLLAWRLGLPRVRTLTQLDLLLGACYVPVYVAIALSMLPDGDRSLGAHSAAVAVASVAFATELGYVTMLVATTCAYLAAAIAAHVVLDAGSLVLLLVASPAAASIIRFSTRAAQRVLERSRAQERAAAAEAARSLALLREEQARREASESQLIHAQRTESIGLLAGGVAHDFNTMLLAIMALADGIDARDESDDTRRDARELKRVATDAAGVCRQMLTVAGRDTPARRVVDLTDLCRDCAAWIQAGLPKNVTLEVQHPPGGFLVEVDETQIQQAMINLVANAAEAMQPTGGTIRLVKDVVEIEDPSGDAEARCFGPLLEPGRHFSILVADSGCGIAPERLPKLFDPYYTTKSGGHGLGLAVTLGIMRRHGGTLRVRSTLGVGTSMELLLPLVGAPATPAPAACPAPARRRPAGERLLLVDDEPVVRDTLGRTLRAGGWHVATAASGAEAIAMLLARSDEPFAAVVLDYSLPDMTGAEVLARARAEGCRTPVVLCTGRRRETLAGDPRPDGFLSKPFDIAQLERLLDEVVG